MASTHAQPIPADIRLAAFISIDSSSDGCWLWTGALSSQGHYPGFTDNDGHFIYAHRFMFEQTYGPVPDCWHVHHTCHNRRCVRPDHLEALSPAEHRARHAQECRESRLVKGSLYLQLFHSGLTRKDIAAKVDRSVATVGLLIREARMNLAALELEAA